MRRGRYVIIVLVALVVVAAASTASMYPSLSDARDTVDTAWRTVRPELEIRYENLSAFSRAVRAAGAGAELLDETDDTLGDWEAVTKGPGVAKADGEGTAANRVEAAGARLARSVTTRPSLRTNRDIVLALEAYLVTDPTATLQAFNDAVERYDNARSRFPGPFFASILGFEALETVEVPGALDELDVPAPPPEEPASTVAEAPTTTSTPAEE